MTKEDIIKTIVIALIGAFSKSFFDNLLGKYIPDKKKLNSYIIKFLVFNLRYSLPLYFLIVSFFDNKPVDKFFVFKVSIFTTVLFFNLLLDMFNRNTKRQYEYFKQIIDILDKTVTKTNDLGDHITTLANNSIKHIEATSELIKRIK